MSDWFNSSGQFNIFQSTQDRGLLQVKLANSQRMAKDLAALDLKYDGRQAKALEDSVNKLGEGRMQVSDWLVRVQQVQKDMNDVRTDLLAMKTAASTGSADAFKLAFDTLNTESGYTKYDANALTANPGSGGGGWSESTQVVDGGGISTNIAHHFLGNDYIVTLEDGTTLRPNAKGDALVNANGGPDTNISDITFGSMTGDTASISIGGTAHTATIKRGGLGVLPAWLYGNFANPADQTRAADDLAAAFKTVSRVELDYNVNEAQLSGMLKSLDNKMQGMTDEFQKISTEELSAKQAERRAIKTRNDIANNSLALVSGANVNFVFQLFHTSPTYEKSSLTDILSKSV
ncbi:MAG: hypothetical protein K2X44_08110 [Magnetospirillum sp.]|nr:hypothetical protein [Magnetospirillum sp.]